MIIDLNNNTNVKTFLFPDNQPHVQISCVVGPSEEVSVVVSMRHSIDVLNLLQVSEAIDGAFGTKGTLYIPYLMGARFDRRMQIGDSVDLKVIAKLINSCEFKRVKLLDVHSDTALQLIERSQNVSNKSLIELWQDEAFENPTFKGIRSTVENSVLVCPDAGAIKKISKFAHLFGAIAYCIKERDLSNGNLTLKVLQPEICAGKNCVIVDDLCDGGGTFNAIASQIPNAASKTLIVTHGIFSKGMSELEKNFDLILTTDSYRIPSGNKTKYLNAFKMMV